MNPADIYNNIVQSVVKLSLNFIASDAPTAGYFDFDSHANSDEMPAADILIGPAGVGMVHEEDGVHVVFALGVATRNDPNLFILRKLISGLYGAVRPTTRLAIYDQTTALPVSWMVTTTPVAVTPMTKAELRSYQFVEVRALIDQSQL